MQQYGVSRVTTVVTTARYKATENQPLWASNPQQSVATVTLGNTSLSSNIWNTHMFYLPE